MEDDEKVNGEGENESVELNDDVLEDVSGGLTQSEPTNNFNNK